LDYVQRYLQVHSILIASPNDVWGKETRSKLETSGYPTEFVANGKDCQIRISKSKFFAIILDFELSDHSAFEVLKFIKTSHPSVKVLLLIKSKETLDSNYLGKNSLSKVGITDVIYGSPTIEKVRKCLISFQGLDNWKNIKVAENEQPDEIVKARDSDFMQINIEDFYSGNVTVFDHYIKLGPNNYKKILHKGDVFDPARIKKYQADGVKYLYLLISDRMNYINFINELVKHTLSKQSTVTKKNILLPLRSITIKYMEEVYTSGLKPELIDEGKSICQNMYEFIKKDKNICKTLEDLQNCDPTALNHSFLVSFFSVFICKQLDWAGKRTVDTIAMGALLHDIGILSLPPMIRETRLSDLNPEQEILYKQHPKLGVDLLRKSSLINEQVLQIIYEHHEHIDGSGYPNQLSGSKVYPLAKIVSLANAFTELQLELKLPPKMVLKEFLKSRDTLQCFDPMLVKSLAKGILGQDE
jgi:putative nucleotidyltransferase with HDIG domain